METCAGQPPPPWALAVSIEWGAARPPHGFLAAPPAVAFSTARTLPVMAAAKKQCKKAQALGLSVLGHGVA